MGRRMITILALLLAAGMLSASPLPKIEELIEHSSNPVLLVDAQSGEILIANTRAQHLFSIDGEAITHMPLIALIPVGDGMAMDLHNTVIPLGTPPLNHLVSIQHLESGSNTYYAIMLQNWESQQKLLVRNRILIIFSVTLLAVSLTYFIIFITIQMRTLRQSRRDQQKQEATLALFQRFLDTDRRFSTVKDGEGRLIFFNSAFKETHQISHDELIGKRLYDLVDVKIASTLDAMDRHIIDTGQSTEIVETFDDMTLNITKFPLTLPDGSPGVGTLGSDITEQIRVERMLRENLRRSALLAEMLSSAFSSGESHLERGLDLACALTDSTAALLLLYDKDEGILSIRGSCRITTPYTELSRATTAFFLERTAEGRAIIENKTPQTNPLASVLSDQLKTLITVPFYNEDKLGGIILLCDNPSGYDDQDGYQVQLLFSALHTSAQKMLREEELRESRRSLRLLLDSTAEGIFGMDSEGKCTFVNASTLSLLGYEREDELLYQNVHSLIHHTGSDGLAQSSKECPILSTIKSGTGLVMENEIFWRKDGTSFDVLAYAYPQLQDGTIVGAVVTFTDNTERKSAQERITYLSLHDQLTGLYNRAYFDQALAEAQRRVILPYSVIVGDVNGLKLTNDIFGHSAGDELLVTIARTLSIHCPPRATISRVGGDEFVILLPHFSQQQSVQLMDQIRASMERENILGGRQAIALGAATRSSAEEPMLEIFDQAEDWMYRQKVLRLRETQHHQLQVLIQVLFDKAPDEEIHALRVQAHALAIGTMLGLDTETMGLLGRAAYYHDIGKLVLDPDLIATKGREASQRRTYQSHVSAGYRILNTFEETMDLAPYVLHHHEWYNGKGYLKGLAGKEIPYLSRILRLAEIWEREGVELKEKEYKILTLQRVAGVEADPQMVERIIASL